MSELRSLLRPVLFTLLVLVCVGDSLQSAPQQLSRFEHDRARMILKIIKEDLSKYYYDPAFHNLRMEESFKTAEDKLAQATSVSQGFAIISRPLLELDDSHTFFIPPGRSTRVEFGWHMQMVGDKCYFTALQEGSDALAKGLKRGDEVLAVDGHRPTRDNLWGLNYVYELLAPRSALRVTVQSPGAQPREAEVAAKVEEKKRLLQLTRGSDLGDFIREMEDRAYLGRHRIEEFGDDLLIWKMPAFDLSPSEVKTNMRLARKRKALVLDLRGNGGGAVETLETMVGSLLDKDTKIGDVESRENLKPIVAKRSGDAYDGKLVVLVDSQSASASELFARVMQIQKRGTVIGDRTSGSVMMSRFYDHGIGDDTQIFFGTSITIANIIMEDGKSLERVGVTPDELILPTAQDLGAGRDPVLSRAAALCGVTVEPEKAGSLFPVEWKR